MAMDLYAHALIGCRKIARVLGIVLGRVGLSPPHHTTINQWIARSGCHQLKQPVEKADDWVALADVTVDIGVVKCLTVVGVRMSVLENQDHMTLSHSDVELLGIYPTNEATGEHFEKALTDVHDKIGGIKVLVIDEGSDVKKGARLHREKHPEVKVLHDIKHKMALVMKRHLEADPKWSEYTAALSQTRSLVYQTELAALKPPAQRTKARYMDISPLIDWPRRLLDAKRSGTLASIPEERYQQYFGWVEEYTEVLEVWSLMVDVVDMICHETRTNGLSEGVYEYMMVFLLEAPLGNRMQTFAAEALEKVLEEVRKVGDEEALVCSTEVLESIFGKYKEINKWRQGITGNVLGINSFVGSKRTDESIKHAMENCSVKEAYDWVKKKVGDTIGRLRRKFLPHKKPINRTKVDESSEGVSLA